MRGGRSFILLVSSFLFSGFVAGSESTPAPEPGRVFTNDDLDARHVPEARPEPTPGAPRPTPGPQRTRTRRRFPTSPPSAASDAPSAPTEGPNPLVEEPDASASWRERGRAARDAVTAAKAKVAEIEAKIAAAKSPFRPGADPYGWYKPVPELPELEQQLKDAQGQLAEAEAAWVQLESEARAANVPPGWVSER